MPWVQRWSAGIKHMLGRIIGFNSLLSRSSPALCQSNSAGRERHGINSEPFAQRLGSCTIARSRKKDCRAVWGGASDGHVWCKCAPIVRKAVGGGLPFQLPELREALYDWFANTILNLKVRMPVNMLVAKAWLLVDRACGRVCCWSH